MWSLALGSLMPILAMAGVSVPTREIAPNVSMPVLSIGSGGHELLKSNSIVQDWLRLGGRGIDTAWIYFDQKKVAAAIAEVGVDRRSTFITTKVPGCLFPESAIESCLKQLGTDYIDLMLIHFPYLGDCSKAWEVLERYHAKGVLRAIGVSNFGRSNLESLLKTAKVVPAVNQIHLNVMAHNDETINFCREHDITVEAYSPLGQHGALSGNAAIKGIAAAHNVSVYQVGLKWILQHGHVLTFQSSSPQHQLSDADLSGFELSAAEMSTLDGLQDKVYQIFA